ncbi:hypothetical protein JTE90_021080 [Oedothorax gibbosus]|uniref:Secreted protein n=1 Tax=Oedothorax gibbosus TaxID=931172 RepID=A0AAV6VSL2_9ARAC|nr:hypothetical protein JTE90_021080 [Oedothorax gibbosus]
MWFVAVILLCASGSKADISNSPSQMCAEKYVPDDVPKNVEEFKVALRSMLKFYECLKSYEVLAEGEYDSMLSFITDISTEGTHLNSIVMGNFPCLKDAIRNRVYNDQTRRDIVTAYKEYQNVKEISEKDNKINCMKWFDEMGDLVNTITTECGNAVEDAVIKLIHRAPFLKRPCSAQDVLELRHILEELNLDESSKAALRESFRLLGKSD